MDVLCGEWITTVPNYRCHVKGHMMSIADRRGDMPWHIAECRRYAERRTGHMKQCISHVLCGFVDINTTQSGQSPNDTYINTSYHSAITSWPCNTQCRSVIRPHRLCCWYPYVTVWTRVRKARKTVIVPLFWGYEELFRLCLTVFLKIRRLLVKLKL